MKDLYLIGRELDIISLKIQEALKTMVVNEIQEGSFDQKHGSRTFHLTINPDTIDIDKLDMEAVKRILVEYKKLREEEKQAIKDVTMADTRKSYLAGGIILGDLNPYA